MPTRIKLNLICIVMSVGKAELYKTYSTWRDLISSNDPNGSKWNYIKFYSLNILVIIKSRVDFQFELTRRRCIILIIICVDVAAVATTTAGKVGGTSDIDKKNGQNGRDDCALLWNFLSSFSYEMNMIPPWCLRHLTFNQ